MPAEIAVLRTGDILIENIIFFDDIVYDLLGPFVDDQHLPLCSPSVQSSQLKYWSYISSSNLFDGVQDNCCTRQSVPRHEESLSSLSRCSWIAEGPILSVWGAVVVNVVCRCCYVEGDQICRGVVTKLKEVELRENEKRRAGIVVHESWRGSRNKVV